LSTVNQDQWVERLKSDGDIRDQAIQELREILLRGLTATVRNRYGNKVSPEDVVQDALLKVLEKIDTFEGRSKFTTWAMTIAVRMAISEMRRKHFQDVSMNDMLSDSMRFEPEATPDPVVGQDESKAGVLSKLRELIESNLSDKQRDAVHCLLNGMPVEIFAEKTGSNRNAVYKLIHDARVKLKQGFEQAGYKAEDINTLFA
jgi:RNA polymerase sigma-70 factor (ECF subfamily)